MSLLQHLNGAVDFLHQAIAAFGASHPTVAQLQRQQVEHLRSTFARSSPTLQESAEVLSQLAHRIKVRSFASEQLCMLPILHRFLIDVVQPLEIMADEIRCFSLLVRIVSLLSLGPEQSVQHTAEIQQSIVEHHTLYRSGRSGTTCCTSPTTCDTLAGSSRALSPRGSIGW